MAQTPPADDQVQRELDYYKKQLDRIAGDAVRNDFKMSSLRHELKQKKEAFAILTHLQKAFTITTPIHQIFETTARSLNLHLAMDRSVIFLPVAGSNTFKAGHWYGCHEEQIPVLEMREVEIPLSELESLQYVLQNKSISPGEISRQIQKIFVYNYFIGVPIRFEGRIIALMVTGRQFEKIPFVPPLNEGDVDTLNAVSGLIIAALQNKKMMEMKLVMKEEAEEKKQIINLFGQQVSQDVAKALMDSRYEKASKKNVAVMFLDIRNFTPFVQNMRPEETVRYLNALFGFMIDIVYKYNGMVNQFLGDGFMTTFGAPIEDPNPFQNAVDAALEIHRTLQEKIVSGEVPPTRIGIGIHGGEAITGNVGSNLRNQYTITGNVVIIAARIEQLTKQYNAQVLISKDIYDKTSCKTMEVRAIGEAQLKGLSKAVELYQLI
jgi:class 3 adenylate cyclase